MLNKFHVSLPADMSLIQQQLFDVNQHYDLLGTKLADRQTELGITVQNVREYLCDVQDIMAWLEEKESSTIIQHLPIQEDEAIQQLNDFRVSIIIALLQYWFILVTML